MVFGLFRGQALKIEIELDHPDGSYVPGDVVGANVTLEAEKGGKVREVRAGLVLQHRFQMIDQRRDSDGDWRDYYEWKTNENWIGREAIAPEGSLPSGFKETRRFDWEIPADAPATCAGDIVQVRWVVKVTVDRAMAKDQNEEVELHVVAPPIGEHTQPGQYGELNTSSGVVMHLDLPTLELVEGDTLKGSLAIEPSQSVDAREVRVELIRDERVSAGDKVHQKQVSVEKVRVAQSPKLVPGSPVTYDFALPVPAAGAPSHDTGDTTVTWLVVGTIDRPMRGDYTVTQWVGVYNG